MAIETIPTQLTDHTKLGVRVAIPADYVIVRREGTGEPHPLVQGLKYIETIGGAHTLPEVAHYRTTLQKGDENRHPVYNWITTSSTVRKFTLPKNMQGVGRKGTEYWLISHTSTPLGITSERMAETIANNTVLPKFGIPYNPTGELGLLENLRDTDKLLKLQNAKALGDELLKPGYAILLTRRQATQTKTGNQPNEHRVEEPFIYAMLGGKTDYLDTLTARFNRDSFYIGGAFDIELPDDTGGAWLASFDGSSGLFVGYDDFYGDTRFLVGSAGGATAHGNTSSNGSQPSLENVVRTIVDKNPAISAENLRSTLKPLW